MSFVRKDGYASNFSEPLIFTVGNVEGASAVNNGTEDDNVSAQGSASLLGGFVNVTEDNYLYILGGVGLGALVLVLIVSGLSRLFSDDAKKEEEWIEDVKEKNDSSSGLSLREKFARAGINVEKEKQTEESVPEDKPAEEEEGEKKGEDEKKREEEDPDPEEVEDVEKKDEKEPAKKEPEKKEKNESEDKEKKPKKGKVYSKEEFMDTFKEPSTMGKETKKIKISLTSKDKS
jgi:hypothetical protein